MSGNRVHLHEFSAVFLGVFPAELPVVQHIDAEGESASLGEHLKSGADIIRVSEIVLYYHGVYAVLTVDLSFPETSFKFFLTGISLHVKHRKNRLLYGKYIKKHQFSSIRERNSLSASSLMYFLSSSV